VSVSVWVTANVLLGLISPSTCSSPQSYPLEGPPSGCNSRPAQVSTSDGCQGDAQDPGEGHWKGTSDTRPGTSDTRPGTSDTRPSSSDTRPGTSDNGPSSSDPLAQPCTAMIESEAQLRLQSGDVMSKGLWQ
jgi:hypothetical protein